MAGDYRGSLEKWVGEVTAQGGSDLHLIAGSPPIIRVSGRLTPLLSEAKLTDADMRGIIAAMLPEADAKHFLEIKEYDFSWSATPQSRFRGNAYFERGHIGIALRFIPRTIPTIAELNLPPILEDFAHRE